MSKFVVSKVKINRHDEVVKKDVCLETHNWEDACNKYESLIKADRKFAIRPKMIKEIMDTIREGTISRYQTTFFGKGYLYEVVNES